jgi:hypothetical protein
VCLRKQRAQQSLISHRGLQCFPLIDARMQVAGRLSSGGRRRWLTFGMPAAEGGKTSLISVIWARRTCPCGDLLHGFAAAARASKHSRRSREIQLGARRSRGVGTAGRGLRTNDTRSTARRGAIVRYVAC